MNKEVQDLNDILDCLGVSTKKSENWGDANMRPGV